MKNPRVGWIDVAKGIGILLVVVGHTGMAGFANKWIWSFHMPLFFFLSGLFFNREKYPSLPSLLKKRWTSLVRPYLIYSLLVMPCWVYVNNDPGFALKTITNGWVGLALWFVPVLFLTELLFYFFLFRWRDNTFLFLAILLSIALFGYLLSARGILLPYKTAVAFTALAFYGTGFLTKKPLFEKINQLKTVSLLFFLALSLTTNGLAVYAAPVRFDMAANLIGDPLPAYIGAFSGILCILTLSRILSTAQYKLVQTGTKLLSYLGKNTFIILALHQTTAQILIQLFNNFSMPSLVSSIVRHLIMWILLFAAIESINRFSPHIVGRIKKCLPNVHLNM